MAGPGSGTAAQTSVLLAPVPQSAGVARRFVASALLRQDDAALGIGEGAVRAHNTVLDIATLLVSELVTNALLHAHTEIEVRCRRFGAGIHVSVRDGSALMPSRRSYADDAATGRGLALIEALATSYGVLAVPGGGKVVWFTVDPIAGQRAGPAWAAASAATHDTFDVYLGRLPLLLFGALQEHNDALLREYTLRGFAAPAATHILNERVARSEAAHAGLSDAVSRAVARVDDCGTTEVDVTVAVPMVVADDLPDLTALLAECEELAAASRFLTRPALPELHQLYAWCTGQIAGQRTGAAPRPWEIATDWEERLATQSDWDDSAIQASAVAAIAADDSNRFIAVNEPAAALLGWPRPDLIGRRIITIIPARLRGAHVAGFTRTVDSGQGSILGQPVRLPALRRDGSEIECELPIERAGRTGAGRSVFVAWLRPI